MKTTINSMDAMAIAHAWSQRGMSYFTLSTGSTEVDNEKYLSSFDDDFGNCMSKELGRPKISHVLCECLPLIDRHNKRRQSILNMERKWCRKDCWFRLLTTMTGMRAGGTHGWHRNAKASRKGKDYFTSFSSELEGNHEIAVRKFSDILHSALTDNKRKKQTQRYIGNKLYDKDDQEISLERIKHNGSKARLATQKQLDSRRKVGAACNATCFFAGSF